MRLVVCTMFAALVFSAAAVAEEQPVELALGTGRDVVESNCGICHSLDYIPMNSPFLDAAGWNAEVTKMIKAFGAPIGEADASVIADYLARNYGS